MGILQNFKNFRREMRDMDTYFKAPVSERAITFYSEKDIYYRYFEGYIDELSSRYKIPISYLDSDPKDTLFDNHMPYVHPYYIKTLLPTVFRKSDSKAIVMTMPDLNQLYLKRAPKEVHHVYIFHTMISSHLQYRKGAFDHYDAIFCIGPHHVEEIRQAEKLYGLPRKVLVECGDPYLEKIYMEYHENIKTNTKSEKRNILIAPTWGKVCILNSCINELIDALLVSGNYTVTVRPHPEYMKREPKMAKQLVQKVNKTTDVTFDDDLFSSRSLYKADILITDQSGIAFEYALGTERPVLFIDTPLKMQNPSYQELGIPPVEISYRSSLGVRVPPEQIRDIDAYIKELEMRRNTFPNDMRDVRKSLIFNWMSSAEKGAKYLHDIALSK